MVLCRKTLMETVQIPVAGFNDMDLVASRNSGEGKPLQRGKSLIKSFKPIFCEGNRG